MNSQSLRRRAVPIALVAGPTAFALGDLARRVVIPGGDTRLSAQVDDVHDRPGLWLAAAFLAVAGSMIWAAGLGAVTFARGRGSTLISLGVGLTWVGLFASVGHAVGFYGQLAAYGRATAPVASAMDKASGSYPLEVTLIVVFIVGVTLGVVLLALGLRRAKLVPVWVPVAAIVFVVAGSVGGVPAGVVGVVAAIATWLPIAGLVAHHRPTGSGRQMGGFETLVPRSSTSGGGSSSSTVGPSADLP